MSRAGLRGVVVVEVFEAVDGGPVAARLVEVVGTLLVVLPSPLLHATRHAMTSAATHDADLDPTQPPRRGASVFAPRVRGRSAGVDDVWLLLLRGVVGGTFVVVFAVLSEMLGPKSFAGIFGAAPSIALASLLVTIANKGDHAARVQSLSMIFAAVAMIAYCVTAVVTVDRFGALRGSALALVSWGVIATLAYGIVSGVS